MKISIIIPTYKPQKYLLECLESIAAQTFPKQNFEVILVLNGCCEPWKTKIENFLVTSLKDMNINFIQTDQAGVSNARNLALNIAKGDYVTFIDDDDMISPYFLQEMYQKASCDIVSVCKPLAFYEGINEFVDYSITKIYHKLNTSGIVSSYKARKYFSGPCMKLIPMKFIKGRQFDTRFKNGEDSIFMFLISDKIKKVAFTSPDAIYYRRFRAGSAMTTNRKRSEIICNNLRMIYVYCDIYFKSPWKYDCRLFITRILGAIHSILVGVKKI